MKGERKKVLENLIFAVLFVTFAFVSVGCAVEDTYTVCSSGCDYSSIQAAVDAAQPGDTIEVHSGTYYENVLVDKSLTLEGEDMPVINAKGEEHSIKITADNSVIRGFKLVNATRERPYWDAGIKVISCGNIIEYNIFENNSDGIRLESDNNEIRNNKIYKSSCNGIRSYTVGPDALGQKIMNNKIHDCGWDGIYGGCSNSVISNNIFENHAGIYLGGSNNTIINNTFKNCGLAISSTPNEIANNTVNGKPIVYRENIEGGEITDAGQVILVSCRDVIVKNCNLSCRTKMGLLITNSSNCSFFNNTCNNNGHGIYLSGSTHNKIRENKFCNNSWNGIVLFSDDNTIENNVICENNQAGIYAYYQLQFYNNNTIKNNKIYNNNLEGIRLHSLNTVITNNQIYGNLFEGIECWNSSSNVIKSNKIYGNGRGIILSSSSSNNTLYNNTVSNNNYGIRLYSSSANLIYNNNFNNTNNAYDDGTNIWNFTKTPGTNVIGGSWLGGNYWSDYAGEDTNADDLGDTLLPHNSNGDIKNGGDWLPLVMAEEEPYTKTDVGVTSNITIANSTDLAAYLPPEYDGMDISDAVVLNVDVTDDTPGNLTDDAYTDITINVGDMDIETCKVFKADLGFLPEVGDVTALPTVKPPGESAFSRDLFNETVTVRLYVGDPLVGVIPSAEPSFFDTGEGTYPSISGTFTGTITPSRNFTVSTLYTHPCAGTGGHTKSIELFENTTPIASGVWSGYHGDWHNITIYNVSGAPYVTLLKSHKYNFTIITGSYPQIVHEQEFNATGGVITCTEFVDVNGKTYTTWIPAIRME